MKKPSAGLSKKQRSNVVKMAMAGKDIGKKGAGFEKVKRAAMNEYRDPMTAQKVAAAAMWRNLKRRSK